MTNLEILTRAFKGLDVEDRENLKFHLEANTPVYCGVGSAERYVSDEGFV